LTKLKKKFSSSLREIKFDSKGLVPVIIQDEKTGQVLMMAYMNRISLSKTQQTGQTYFWSRSRKKLWHKGETSGHVQQVRQILLDCDSDTLLIKVRQKGAACHTGHYSCFHRRFISEIKEFKVIGKKVFDPKKVYQK
jgi:phosphoribosyl-ATP pyrophosphohydrolase/phosphoribosyl-AMP cyclohydrolase